MTSTKKRQPDRDLPDAVVLELGRAILERIKPANRIGATAPGRKSTLKTKSVTVRLPKALLDELGTLDGYTSYHVERAVLWYLRILGEESGPAPARSI